MWNTEKGSMHLVVLFQVRRSSSLTLSTKIKCDDIKITPLAGGGKELKNAYIKYKLLLFRYFCYSSMQKIGRRALERFSSQKFHFEIFPKTNAISITFGPRYIHRQSFEEIDFPTRNAVDRF